MGTTMSNLVILESPGKIKAVSKYLGPGYQVIASKGHCIDLPVNKIGVDIKKDFEPTFVPLGDRISTLHEIKTLAKKSDAIYLFTDMDREGCAISSHLAGFLGMPDKVWRIKSNQITKEAIQHAMQNPHKIEEDTCLFDAYLCRRIMDRLCGYKTSFLTQQATGGRSAGRVQSAMLRIIVDREKEIIHFVPEEYWVLTAQFLTNKGECYTGKLDEKIKVPNETTATEIFNKVQGGSPVVSSVEIKTVNANPYPPFTTNGLIQSGSTCLGWGADKIMKVAQGLYEAGHITYMRTDSPFMAAEAIQTIRHLAEHQYGAKYVPANPNYYSAKAGSQEGHECCRPTHFENGPGSLDGDDRRMYDLIWRRAVASQMTPGQDERQKIITLTAGYDFVSHGNRCLFDGHRRVWTYSDSEDVTLPMLKEGEVVSLKSLEKDQKFTTPPSRYSDASLNKKCEKEQISRPATFASFVKTLQSRGYISKKGKSFQATELGIAVTDFLINSNMCFVDIAFTANMEQLLDDVAADQKQKTPVLTDFWTRLKGDIANAQKVKAAAQVTEHVCPKCGGHLLQKHSKWGGFYSCENYKPAKKNKDGEKVTPEGSCTYTAKIGDHGEPIEKVPVEKEYAPFDCNKCGGKMVKRTSKYGEFFGCQTYPACKTTADMDGNFKESKVGGKKWKWKGKKAKKADDEHGE